ncbi:hypothetical protein ACQP1K_23605 [Sphaerimonospora sp. CA-214678]|uniref:hypothetical protein n=1 Tax=Sphaerimonospora sp. CA-214678 TaxID=3240029 RepID=UPI003D8A2908
MSISSGPECDLPDERLLLFFTCGHPALPAEDHGRWDRATIEEGLVFVHEALAGGPTGPYVVQATIAALHDEAADLATTDWPQIVALYDVRSFGEPRSSPTPNPNAPTCARDRPSWRADQESEADNQETGDQDLKMWSTTRAVALPLSWGA